MILYNTTFIVDTRLSDQFTTWVSTRYITTAIESGLLEQPLLTRILQPADISAGPSDCNMESFALQFKSPSLEASHKWDEEVAPVLINEFHRGRSAESLLSFSTFMEIL